MKVEVEEKVKGESKKVYAALKKYLDKHDMLKTLGGKLAWDDKKCSAKIDGGQFSGAVQVLPEGKDSCVSIKIDLPILLIPFKSKVEAELKKHLSRVRV